MLSMKERDAVSSTSQKVTRPKQLVVVGSMNMDLVLEVEEIPRPGETNIGRNLHEFPGGKGSNQAAAAAKLGAQVSLIAMTGEDSFGEVLRDRARAIGIDVTHVEVTPEANTGIALITVSRLGENSIVVVPGANSFLKPENAVRHLRTLGKFEVISACLEIPIETIQVTFSEARNIGALTVLNASPFTADAIPLLAQTDYLLINEHEIFQITKRDLKDKEDVRKCLKELGASHVVITLGAAGALYLNVQSEYEDFTFDAPQVVVRDTTGCGDAFAGTLAAELTHGKTIHEAIKIAVKAGSFAATGAGAQPSYGDRNEILSI